MKQVMTRYKNKSETHQFDKELKKRLALVVKENPVKLAKFNLKNLFQ